MSHLRPPQLLSMGVFPSTAMAAAQPTPPSQFATPERSYKQDALLRTQVISWPERSGNTPAIFTSTALSRLCQTRSITMR